MIAAVTDLIDAARAAGVRAVARAVPAGARSSRASAWAGRALPVSTPADALEVFLRRVDRYAEREPHVAAHLLGGLAGPGVDERRRQLAARVPQAVLAGLAGQDDGVSWELRECALGRRHAGGGG